MISNPAGRPPSLYMWISVLSSSSLMLMIPDRPEPLANCLRKGSDRLRHTAGRGEFIVADHRTGHIGQQTGVVQQRRERRAIEIDFGLFSCFHRKRIELSKSSFCLPETRASAAVKAAKISVFKGFLSSSRFRFRLNQ